jgi:beta-N-acetylhexosaminidase
MPVILLAAAIFLSACSPTHPPAATPAAADPVPALLATLTLEQKLGQRIMTAVPGTVAGEAARRLIAEGGLGGFIVTQQNIADRDQLAEYTAGLQGFARGSPTGIGLLAAVDQEGGRVNRFRAFHTFVQFPPAWYAGATGDPAYVEAVAYLMAKDLASVGIMMNLAPVLDLSERADRSLVGDRAFGSDPATVGELGTAFLRGTYRAGAIAAAKHFPGHGATADDSHTTLPEIDLGPGPELDRHLAPFKAAIAAGAEAIMTAHLLYPALDPRDPASFSAPIIRNLLRKELGFDGVVISDSIGMQAVRQNYARRDVLARTFAADVDIILARDSYDLFTLRDELAALVRSGAIAMTDVDRGTSRVLELKRRHGLLPANEGAAQ